VGRDDIDSTVAWSSSRPVGRRSSRRSSSYSGSSPWSSTALGRPLRGLRRTARGPRRHLPARRPRRGAVAAPGSSEALG